MVWTVQPTYDTYEAARESFEWDLPESYSPAVDLVRKHEEPTRTALRHERDDGTVETHSFADLADRSARLAGALASLGVESGDRVGVVVPQHPANPIAHLANWTLGAVSVPLTVLFGPDALEYRLADSGARAVVVDASVRETVESVRDACPDLEWVVEVGGPAAGDAHAFGDLVEAAEPLEPVAATPETPTAIMYTSGSTGPPKGVLHRHALWLGRAAAANTYFEGLSAGATLWTPADWAWGAALGGTLFAAWHHGAAVVARARDGFDPAGTLSLLERHGVSHTFMPPTALRMLLAADVDPADHDLALEVVASAGEPLTPEVLEWVDRAFTDVAINEFYGQTELNLVVGNCSRWFAPRPGSMGRPLPGYEVAVLDEETREPRGPDAVGELAVRPGDERVFFDAYWGRPERTAEKRTDDGWYLTGDLVERDADGHLRFVSRADDVILTSGYRVGPTEVEEAILEHEAVEQVGVVGEPDEVRGERIVAYVQPAGGAVDESRLREEIRELVRTRLAAYEYPRRIEFVRELPTTSTGKIRRKTLRDRSG